jgi:hypothetical protein
MFYSRHIFTQTSADVTDKTPALSAMGLKDPLRKLVLQSLSMDFVHPDSAPARQLNEVIVEEHQGEPEQNAGVPAYPRP